MAFATLTMCQLFHAFDVRSEHHSLLHIGIFTNKAMNRAFVIGMAMQLSVLCIPPLQRVFSVVSMDAAQWLVVLALAAAPLFICETVKALTGQNRK
jgi:Ca2+-transporting ATPase